MKKIKNLCGIKKNDFHIYKDEVIKIVNNPNFICKKCLRVANEKKYLCKAESF